MSLSLLERMTAYDELVERHDLTLLKVPGDWHFSRATRDGDIFVGEDNAYNAMRRLVLAWSYGTPTMRLIFGSLQSLRDERPGIEAELEAAHRRANLFIPGSAGEDRILGLEAYHLANEALDAGEVGCGVLSGCLTITVQSMLGRFRGDLKPSNVQWNDAQPAINGISAGRLIAAAANAFRHADEWAEAHAQHRFSKQQLISMDALREALPGPGDAAEIRIWDRALTALSQGKFEDLGKAVLTFAHDVASKVRCAAAQN